MVSVILGFDSHSFQAYARVAGYSGKEVFIEIGRAKRPTPYALLRLDFNLQNEASVPPSSSITDATRRPGATGTPRLKLKALPGGKGPVRAVGLNGLDRARLSPDWFSCIKIGAPCVFRHRTRPIDISLTDLSCACQALETKVSPNSHFFLLSQKRKQLSHLEV